MKWLLLVMTVGLLLVGCGDDGRGKNKTVTRQLPTATPSSHQSPASSPHPTMPPGQPASSKKNAWPFTDGKKPQGKTADNLLTRNIYVVYDGSGSMSIRGCSGSYTKAEAAGRALIEFSRRVSGQSNLGLLVFDQQGTSERVPLGVNNRNAFKEAVMRVVPYGGTPLRSAIEIAKEKLTLQARKQLGYGEYHLVVVTDGAASAGQNPRRVVNEILAGSPIIVHTIGFCIGTNHSLNQPGRVIYKSANNYAALKQGLEGILAEAQDFTITEF